MQEVKQEESIECSFDCFNCPYPDCVVDEVPPKLIDTPIARYNREYQKSYRETHKERVRQLQHDWYVRNAEKRKERNEARKRANLLAKLKTCSYCRSETGNTVMVYHRKVYCSEKCLMEYMLLKAKQKEIRVIEKEELK